MHTTDRVQTTGDGIFDVAQHGIDPVERRIFNAGPATAADNALMSVKRLIEYSKTRQAVADDMAGRGIAWRA